MYCKNCGKDLGDENNKFCPYCGIKLEENSISALLANMIKKPRRKYFSKKVVVPIVIVIILSMSLLMREEAQNLIDGFSEIEFMEKSSEELLIGTWHSTDYDITFTESGYIRIGKNNLKIGGNNIIYEIESENTLYISGGDLPAGVNVDFYVTETELILDTFEETAVFYRE